MAVHSHLLHSHLPHSIEVDYRYALLWPHQIDGFQFLLDDSHLHLHLRFLSIINYVTYIVAEFCR